MRSPKTEYKKLKFLMVLALVIAACVIAVAENDDTDSTEASTEVSTEVSNEASTEASNEVLTEVSNEVSNEVSATVITPDANSIISGDPIESDASVTIKDTNIPVNKNPNGSSATVTPTTWTSSAVGVDANNGSSVLEQRMLKTISVDFINTPIEDVIKMIAEQADVDIIKSPTVTGTVTAKLTNVPLREALDNILALHGYACVIDRNMIRVAPHSEIAQKEELLDTRVYHITYADVKDIEAALKKIISKRGSLSCSQGTSDIIVTDSESKIKAIDSFIAKVDRVTPQVLVEVRIYDISSTDGFDLGADWTSGRNTPITEVQVDEIANTSTGARTTDTTTKGSTSTWQNNTAGVTSAADYKLYRKSKPFVGGDFDATTAGTIRLGFLDTVNVEFALNILRSQVGAKLLANPRILVLDNETADFKIVTQVPYTDVSQTSSGGSMTTTKFKDVGVSLGVIPHVTREGMVRLNISPEFSVRVGSTSPPTVDTRRMNTKALIKDGQTVVIGGLRKREVTQDVTKVPFLGDIPLLGKIFTNSEEQVVTNELIIFITPRIIVTQDLSENELRGLEATNFSGPKASYTEYEKAEQKAEKTGK